MLYYVMLCYVNKSTSSGTNGTERTSYHHSVYLLQSTNQLGVLVDCNALRRNDWNFPSRKLAQVILSRNEAERFDMVVLPHKAQISSQDTSGYLTQLRFFTVHILLKMIRPLSNEFPFQGRLMVAHTEGRVCHRQFPHRGSLLSSINCRRDEIHLTRNVGLKNGEVLFAYFSDFPFSVKQRGNFSQPD